MSRIPDFSQIPFQQAPAQGDAEFAAWKEKLKTETGKSFEENFYRTMEQINVAPLYDVNAYKDCEHLHYMAGIPPFLRGPYSTMYVTKTLDSTSICRLLYCRRIKCFLSP